jgi:hypothetical protein
MKASNLAAAGALALLAAGLAGCGQGPEREARVVPQARETTRPTSEAFGDFIVHFNAQATSNLPAEVARNFGIERSDTRAMLNITVLRRGAEPGGAPVRADVTVTATNLVGQFREITIREHTEGESVYYIGELAIADEEIFTFDVRVRPEGADQAHEFSFQQQFYTN